jgi:hypothetical protein
MPGLTATEKEHWKTRITAPAQIRTLWSKVGTLLDDESTQLERDVLALKLVRED